MMFGLTREDVKLVLQFFFTFSITRGRSSVAALRSWFTGRVIDRATV